MWVIKPQAAPLLTCVGDKLERTVSAVPFPVTSFLALKRFLADCFLHLSSHSLGSASESSGGQDVEPGGQGLF